MRMKDKLICSFIKRYELAQNVLISINIDNMLIKNLEEEISSIKRELTILFGGKFEEAVYEDSMSLYAKSFNNDETVYVYSADDGIVEKLQIVHSIIRSDDPNKYDAIGQDNFINMCSVKFDASGEVTTDDDTVYVFCKRVDEGKSKRKFKLIVVVDGEKKENEEILNPLKDALIGYDIADNFPTIEIFSDEVRRIKDFDNVLDLLANLVKTEKDDEKSDLLWGAYNLVKKLKYNESDFIEIKEEE